MLSSFPSTDTYQALLRRQPLGSEPIDDVISRDINRTFPKHPLFAAKGGIGQTALQRMLAAYARLDPAVGYCQGMGFLAAVFLSYFPEQEAFWMFFAVMTREPWNCRQICGPGLPLLALKQAQLDALVAKYLPRVAAAMHTHGLSSAVFSTHWFLTAFSYSFPFPVVARLWDAWLAEGWKPIFRAALAALHTQANKLSSGGFEQFMTSVQQLHAVIPGPDEFMEASLKYKFPSKMLAHEAATWMATHPDVELIAELPPFTTPLPDIVRSPAALPPVDDLVRAAEEAERDAMQTPDASPNSTRANS